MNTELMESDTESSELAMPDKSAMDMATTRQAQEVQAAMMIAKRFPRDELAAIGRIKRSCARPALAEVASYSYARGGSKVTGPSIRLAEAVAQAWGNLDYGVVELEQNTRTGESVCMAYCWDLETNTRSTKVFNVPHRRYTREGSYALTDPRDIYETVANSGARRVRACILGVIPGDVVDLAEAECEKTLLGKNDKPLADRIRDMVSAFEKFAVSREMIERRLGHRIEATSVQEIATLQKIFTSLKDGVGNREQFFEIAEPDSDKPNSRTDSAKKKVSTPAKSAKPVSYEDMQSRVMSVTSLAAVGQMRTELAASGLPTEQQNELYGLLDSAQDQFLQQQ